MPIRFLCYNCAAKIKVPDGTQGRKVKCPSCGSLQRVPAQTSEMSAPTAAPVDPPADPTPAPTKRNASPPPPPVEPPAPQPVEDAPAPAPAPVEEAPSSAPYELVSDEPAAPADDQAGADSLDPLAALAAAAVVLRLDEVQKLQLEQDRLRLSYNEVTFAYQQKKKEIDKPRGRQKVTR